MNTFAKLIAGLALAAATAFAVTSPSLASCGCDDESYDDASAYGWYDVGQDIWVDHDGTAMFEIELDGHQTLDIGIVSELIQENYEVDLDITIVAPDGREFTAEEIGDDELTIRTGQGGTFTIYVDNYDESLGTYFYLYVV